MRLSLRRNIWIMGCLILCAVVSHARVFRAGGMTDELLGSGLPWQAALRTPMTVNGRPVMMHLYTARFSEPATEQLRARFEELGAEVILNRSAEGVTGVARWPDREASFIVIAPHDQPLQQIVVYYPKPGAVEKTVQFPVPVYARGEVSSTVSNDATGSFMGMIQTTDPTGDVYGFYGRALVGEGWTLVTSPPMRNGVVHGLAVYEKKNRTCFLQVSEQPDGFNIITLLVKGAAL